ncbi:hypothetical protein U1769_01965 [Sphingomonas sp. ZT3P38]|uniref:hypothetical protein n=1 Tax=Parasphingomonas zepuensis TaxID=3096161 RepID=UPI002FC929E7
MATLERVLMGHADADAALLLHASLLCRLDDRDGARAEREPDDQTSPDAGTESEPAAVSQLSAERQSQRRPRRRKP